MPIISKSQSVTMARIAGSDTIRALLGATGQTWKWNFDSLGAWNKNEADARFQPIGTYATASNSMTFTNKSGNISQWTNDANYLTSASISGKLNISDTAAMLDNYLTFINSAMVVSALGFTPVTNARTITINGTTQDLSANRTFNVAFPGVNTFAAYSAGTAYTITTSMAKVDFGTTDPEITITTAGKYEIKANIKIQYSGLTTLAVTTLNFKLRRTNNTASDLPDALTSFTVPVLTLASQTGGDCDFPVTFYTTLNANDVIEMQAQRGAISVGTITVGEASITATRIN